MKRLLAFLIFFLIINPVLAFPQRIISTMPSITEMLFALGLQDRVVGVTLNCNYPPEARTKEKIGRESINLEMVVQLKPDLIIMLEDAQKKEVDKLKKFGLPVYTINPHSVADIMEAILNIGKICGVTAEAERLAIKLDKKIEKYEARSGGLVKKKAFFIVGDRPLISVGRNTFLNDVMIIAGLLNISAQANSPYPQYNYEQLIYMDPEVLIIPEGLITPEELKQQRWQRLSAVRNGKIIYVDPDIIFRPGPRIVEAIGKIADNK